MKCPKCQSDIAKEARFCGECGSALAEAPAAAARPEVDLSGLRTLGGLQTIDDDSQTRNPRGGQIKTMQPGDVFANRYAIAALVGEGGMGVVYRARDNLTEKDVALKLIRADRLAGRDAVKRLIREGVTSRDIRHPNVVAVYDVGEAGEQPYMSMEFLDGRSLRAWNRQRMQSGEDCSMAAAANIVREILGGLEAAHRVGVVHRDLKPENVMLLATPNDTEARLKLLDFGIARAGGAGDTGTTSLGTRGYMAPEQITAPDAAQPSADLYSLSVIFYELLVGVVPQGHWQPPSGGRTDVPPAIDALIQKGLSNNPRARPQSVADYLKALNEAMKAGASPSAAGASLFAAQPWLKKLEATDLKPLVDGIRSTTDNLRKTTAETLKPKQPVQTLKQAPAGQLASAAGMPPSSASLWSWFKYTVTRRYADGKGRACRKEYWSFTLFFGVLVALCVFADMSSEASHYGYGYQPQLTYLPYLALGVPSVALTARRLHDVGWSGWLALFMLLALDVKDGGGLVSIAFFVLGFIPGAKGANKYGPSPLEPTAAEALS